MKQQAGIQETSLTAEQGRSGWHLFHNDTQQPVRQHWHAYLEILYLGEGACRMQTDSSWHDLQAGDLFVISAGSTHSFPDLSGCRFLVLQITADFLCSSSLGSEWQYLIPFLQPDQSCLAHCHLGGGDLLLALLQDIETDEREKPPGYDLDVKGKLFCLFAQLVRRGAILYPRARQQGLLQKLESALTYIEKNSDSEIKIGQAAGLCFMSEHYFSRCFHLATGRTFSAYLQHVRLHRVRELLIRTDLPIEIIALQTGFATASHLAAVFRKLTGLTPSAWRLEYKNLRNY
ncbi:MAG TPA: hypothetical protein DD640_00415 [Clostridiales bacterium]|nr:hypothetical protein [Clostridiales bacterium]